MARRMRKTRYRNNHNRKFHRVSGNHSPIYNRNRMDEPPSPCECYRCGSRQVR